jgi:hypothetical protein
MEEGFISGVYHHLLYTVQMIWDHTEKTIGEVSEDMEDTQHRFKVWRRACACVCPAQ